MRDWIDIINDKIQDAELPLPDNDWEWFEAKFRQRRRIKIMMWSAISSVAAILIFLMLSHTDNKVNNVVSPRLVSYSADTVDTRVLVEPVISAPIKRKEGNTSSDNVQETPNTQEVVAVSTGDPEDTVATEVIKPIIESRNAASYLFETQDNKNNRKHIAIVTGVTGLFGASFHNTYSVSSVGHSPAFGGSPFYLSGEAQFKSNHSLPVSYGVNLSIPLNDRFSLTTGMALSKYKSLFTLDESLFQGQTFVQKAYYLGIPFRLDMTLWERNRFSVWAGAGGEIDRLLYGIIGDNKLNDNTFHLSAIANLGMNYELFDNVCLYFAPQMSLYFRPENPKIITYRTESPLYVSLNLGITINL